MNPIIEQLQHDAQQCQPDFSESLHRRCIDAIDQAQPKWGNTVKSEPPVPASRYAQYKLAIVTAITFVVGFVIFNSYLKPIRQSESSGSRESAVADDNFEAIPIDLETWEQLEQVSLVSDRNYPQVDSEKIKGRSASVYTSVTNLIHEKTTAKAITKSIICQDLSMGNLLVKAGDLVDLSGNVESEKCNFDKQ